MELTLLHFGIKTSFTEVFEYLFDILTVCRHVVRVDVLRTLKVDFIFPFVTLLLSSSFFSFPLSFSIFRTTRVDQSCCHTNLITKSQGRSQNTRELSKRF